MRPKHTQKHPTKPAKPRPVIVALQAGQPTEAYRPDPSGERRKISEMRRGAFAKTIARSGGV